MKTKKKFNYNLLSCVFIYAWSALFFFSSLKIQDSGSRIFPQVMCGIATALATVFLITILVHNDTSNGEGGEISFAGSGRAAIMGALLVVYIVANYLFGFYIATALYMPAGMLFLGQRNWKPIVFVTGGLLAIVWVFFDLILKMQMPNGLFIG